MDEQRIIELETRLAYQEHTLHELNDVMSDQQKQLTRLKRLLDTLNGRIEALAEAVPAGGAQASERPPHY